MTPKRRASDPLSGRRLSATGEPRSVTMIQHMPAVTRAIAAFGVAIACILHVGADAHAAPGKKPKSGLAKKPKKAEPPTTPAATEPAPAPEPAAPPLPA